MWNKLVNELASSVPDGMSVVSAAFPAREIVRSISAPSNAKTIGTEENQNFVFSLILKK